MTPLQEQLESLRGEIIAGRYDVAVEWLDIAIRNLEKGMPVQEDFRVRPRITDANGCPCGHTRELHRSDGCAIYTCGCLQPRMPRNRK